MDFKQILKMIEFKGPGCFAGGRQKMVFLRGLTIWIFEKKNRKKCLIIEKFSTYRKNPTYFEKKFSLTR